MEHEDDYDRGYHYPIFRMIFGIIIFLIVVSIVVSIVGGVFFGSSVMMMGTGWHFLWAVVGLLFLIWLLSWIFGFPWRYRYRHQYWMGGEDHAVRILRRRYARGEISESEFRKRMKNLKEK